MRERTRTFPSAACERRIIIDNDDGGRWELLLDFNQGSGRLELLSDRGTCTGYQFRFPWQPQPLG